MNPVTSGFESRLPPQACVSGGDGWAAPDCKSGVTDRWGFESLLTHCGGTVRRVHGPPEPVRNKMKIRHLDFSEFHPLDHNLWECRGYPGGRRRHLRFRWEFQWKDDVLAHTACRVGVHRFIVWHRASPGPRLGEPVVHDDVHSVVCRGCGRRASPAERSAALVDEREMLARRNHTERLRPTRRALIGCPSLARERTATPCTPVRIRLRSPAPPPTFPGGRGR